MSIGERIKEERKRQGLSVEFVADHIGRDRSTVYRYEKDEVEIPATVVSEIADILNCNPAFLMGWSENAETNTTSLTITIRGQKDVVMGALGAYCAISGRQN